MQYKVPEQLTLYYREPAVPLEVTARKLPLEANAFLKFPSVFLSKACYTIRSMAHISNTTILISTYYAYLNSVIKYGIIFLVILPKVGRFSVYKRKSLELWLVHNPEIHAEVYYRLFHFHDKHFH